MRKIQKLLVANRGEIALRVMRSAKEMGIQTVAIYSEADRNALHVKFADEAVYIGKAPSNQSYLLGDKIIEICLQLNVDAIHPGYGFLSENALFARKVAQAGLIFIGPSPESIEMMGSKIGAKRVAQQHQIPMVPGTPEAITDIAQAKQAAQAIGYPILIKASAGGGGKGMRIVETETDFEEQMQRAMSEAQSAFGDSAVFIEKFITSPKHIEIQILGDKYGNLIYLFERECSIQRRYQKLIEEAPSPVVSPEMRKAMGECAVRIAQACGYYSAGTVEFVVDEHYNFYFLEVNTRLQVEHPVTELITGIDLVKEQIRIAQDEKLNIKQEDLRILGHAIEVRVCAEDPKNNFLPEVGKLQVYKRPQGVGIRVDDGFEQGMEIPLFYDSMIAKLIAYGKDRHEAIARMKRAIDEYQIVGIATTLEFCKFVLQHEQFLSGKFDTNFIKNFYQPELLQQNLTEQEAEVAACVIAYLLDHAQPKASAMQTVATVQSNWKRNRT
ncbi:MAG: acetyl-CoA carboxylase biotin carboxylase subunit [Microscillaceae bacterium]|nr:acetyl-CoA carboxylase biotin carboxylase subunit [Microscillaceae bacterium]MDW8459923.1 acetyl-CoA carboxylase biotin carboxylase subunit [Cytophagales bacterium]